MTQLGFRYRGTLPQNRLDWGELWLSEQMSRNEKQFLIFCSGLVAVMLLAIGAFALGYHAGAGTIGWGGTVCWMAATVVWIVLFDSRRRWPGTNRRQRLVRLFSFER